MEEGGERSKRLSFFTYKSSCMEDSMREATWSDGEASVEAVFTAMLPPLPMPLEERWKRMMSAYQTQVGEEAEEEHLYDEVASSDCGSVPDVVRLCEKCGWIRLDEDDDESAQLVGKG